MKRTRNKKTARIIEAEKADPAGLPASTDEEYLKRGLTYHARGEQDKAVADLLKAISLNEDSVDAHYNLGLIYRDMGKTGDARAAFKTALDKTQLMTEKNPARALMLTRLATWQLNHLNSAG